MGNSLFEILLAILQAMIFSELLWKYSEIFKGKIEKNILKLLDNYMPNRINFQFRQSTMPNVGHEKFGWLAKFGIQKGKLNV